MILATSTQALSLSMRARRDIVVVARGPVDAPSEVRALAQCATAALHLQTGMRHDTKLWLLLPDRCGDGGDGGGGGGLTLACDGAGAQMLPVMGKTIKRILESSSDDDSLESLTLPPGWQVYCDDTLEQRLACLLTSDGELCRRMVVIDGSGISPLLTVEKTLPPERSNGGGNSLNSGTVVLLTVDASGFTDDEVECFDSFGGGALLASVSPLPLLPSHTIILAHAVLDAAENVPTKD